MGYIDEFKNALKKDREPIQLGEVKYDIEVKLITKTSRYTAAEDIPLTNEQKRKILKILRII